MGFLSGPRQAVLITCRSRIKVLGREVEKDNVFMTTWHMPVSSKPQRYAVSVGLSQFSHDLIRKGKCYVVNFMPVEMKDKVWHAARRSGEHINKFAQAGLETHEAKSIDCGRIVGALAYLECEVIQEIPVGDHTLFIGKVVNGDVLKEAPRLYHIDEDRFTTTKEG